MLPLGRGRAERRTAWTVVTVFTGQTCEVLGHPASREVMPALTPHATAAWASIACLSQLILRTPLAPVLSAPSRCHPVLVLLSAKASRGHIAANQGCLRHQLVVRRYHVVRDWYRFASLNGRYVARGQRRASCLQPVIFGKSRLTRWLRAAP